MSFSFTSWKESFQSRLQGWRERMQRSGVESIYAFISASAIWPVIQATTGGEWVAALSELGKVLSGIGTNILADRLQKWKEESGPASIGAQIEKDVQTDNALRAELDKLLESLDALPLAGKSLSNTDRVWFEETLKNELSRMGNVQKFKAVLSGSGAIAQGTGARAVVGTLVEGDVHGGVHSITQNIAGPESPGLETLRNSYLNRLSETSRQLSLAGVDPKAATGEKDARLNLDAVYTALLTLAPEAHESTLRGKSPEKEIRRQSALAQLNQHPRLVLLGDPGSGKSTFVNFVALCLSGELLGDKERNITLLTAPLPVEDDKKTRPQTWGHGALLPVRVILRDFAAQGLPAAGEKATAAHLWKFIEADICSATLEKYAASLQKELREVGGILLLGGLDEVPDAELRRLRNELLLLLAKRHTARIL